MESYTSHPTKSKNEKLATLQSQPHTRQPFIYKRHNAKIRKEIIIAKHKRFETFIKAIDSPNETLIDPSKMADYFAEVWVKYAPDSNFCSSFNSAKSTFDSTANTAQDKKGRFLEHLITICEYS